MFYRKININGIEYDLAVNVFGEGAPTSDTSGAVGMFYIDTNTDDVYKCVAEGNVWKKIDGLGSVKSGTMAFEIKAVNGSVLTLDSTSGIEVGYTYSMQIGNNYNAWGEITAISGNTVTVNNMPTNYVLDTDKVKFIFFPEHTELGTFKIGEGAYCFGIDNKANMDGAFSTGEGNTSDGKRSFTSGKNNFAGYQDAAFGQNNNVNGFNNLASGDSNTIGKDANNSFVAGHQNQITASNSFTAGNGNHVTGENGVAFGNACAAGGKNSFAGGQNSQTYKKNSFVFGEGLESTSEGQTIVGKYNATYGNQGNLFVVGTGTSKDYKSNGLAVDTESNLKIGDVDNSSTSFIRSTKSIVCGTNHQFNIGSCAHIGGQHHQAYGENMNNIIMHGSNLWATGSNQAAFGQFNHSAPNLIFTVGVGSADDARKNGLEVTVDGRASVATNPIYDMDVTTKQYVDNEINNAKESILSSNNPAMELGVEYCTAERWDNKPVYIKRFNFGALPNSSQSSIQFDTSGNIDKIISCELVYDSNGAYAGSIPEVESYYAFAWGGMYITTNRNASHISAEVVVKYTKK